VGVWPVAGLEGEEVVICAARVTAAQVVRLRQPTTCVFVIRMCAPSTIPDRVDRTSRLVSVFTSLRCKHAATAGFRSARIRSGRYGRVLRRHAPRKRDPAPSAEAPMADPIPPTEPFPPPCVNDQSPARVCCTTTRHQPQLYASLGPAGREARHRAFPRQPRCRVAFSRSLRSCFW
jgi:hypothetical protein